MPSKGFEKQEQEHQGAEVELASKEIANKTRIFCSLAKQLVIGNFVEAEYSGGKMIRAESGLRFHGNIKTTADPKEIEFILNSRAFADGACWEAKTMDDARDKITQHSTLKGVKHTQVSDISSTEMTLT